MKNIILSLSVLCLSTGVAFAAVEPDYAPDKPPVTNPWYAKQSAAERQADLDFITGMKPHHEGALSMSNEYLQSKDASHGPLIALAKGIIHNQTFEIGMLARVKELVGKPLQADPEWRQIAEKGLAQKQRFTRAPMPAGFGGAAVSRRDVEFAKAMIVHHEGALTMCNDYLSNPNATNKYVRLLCVDILTDQKMEINLMHSIVGKYAGNPDDVKIDPSMIHGMEGMNHGAGGHAAHAPAKKVNKQKTVKPEAHDMQGMGHAGHGAAHH